MKFFYKLITFKTNKFMKFKTNKLIKLINKFHETALFQAIEKENIEIIKLLLTNENIDVNIINILT